MSAVTANLTKSLESEVLRCLGGGVDTQRLDDFLDRMFELADQLGGIACTLADDRTLRIQSRNTVLQEVKVPLAKTKLRMLCARLAVRCGEWANRSVTPYGDMVEFDHPVVNHLCKVHFENTTAAQQFAIEVFSAPRSTETA